MGSVAQLFGRAVRLHRQAVSLALDAEAQLRAVESDAVAVGDAGDRQRLWAGRLQDLARAGLRGWLGARLDASALELPLGVDAPLDRPMFVKVGDACPTRDSAFWAVAPFVGVGHLAVDTDARDRAVAG